MRSRAAPHTGPASTRPRRVEPGVPPGGADAGPVPAFVVPLRGCAAPPGRAAHPRGSRRQVRRRLHMAEQPAPGRPGEQIRLRLTHVEVHPVQLQPPSRRARATDSWALRCSNCCTTLVRQSCSTASAGARPASLARARVSSAIRSRLGSPCRSHRCSGVRVPPGSELSSACMAPQPECPHTVMERTFSTSTAYSIAAATESSRSPRRAAERGCPRCAPRRGRPDHWK